MFDSGRLAGPIEFGRQALHAYRLAFAHPASGAALEFRAPLPEDLRQALGHWGLRYNDFEWLQSHAP